MFSLLGTGARDIDLWRPEEEDNEEEENKRARGGRGREAQNQWLNRRWWPLLQRRPQPSQELHRGGGGTKTGGGPVCIPGPTFAIKTSGSRTLETSSYSFFHSSRRAGGPEEKGNTTVTVTATISSSGPSPQLGSELTVRSRGGSGVTSPLPFKTSKTCR